MKMENFQNTGNKYNIKVEHTRCVKVHERSSLVSCLLPSYNKRFNIMILWFLECTSIRQNQNQKRKKNDEYGEMGV